MSCYSEWSKTQRTAVSEEKLCDLILSMKPHCDDAKGTGRSVMVINTHYIPSVWEKNRNPDMCSYRIHHTLHTSHTKPAETSQVGV